MAEIRKVNGSIGVHQSGESLLPARIMRLPSDDWCMVGSNIPRAMKKIINLLTLDLVPVLASRKAGENSIQSTPIYIAIHSATSRSTELKFVYQGRKTL